MARDDEPMDFDKEAEAELITAYRARIERRRWGKVRAGELGDEWVEDCEENE